MGLATFVAALNEACDTEENARQRRHEGAVADFEKEHVRLQRRQEEAVDKNSHATIDVLQNECELECKERKEHQDTVAEALAVFIRAFQKNVKEKALVV